MKSPLNKLLSSMDFGDFYSDIFGKLNKKANLNCPFPDRHKEGEDKLPSFRVFLDTGGTYCHGCGYKSTNPVYFWADYKKIPFDRALRRLYSTYVEPVVPTNIYKDFASKLQSNRLVLDRLLKLRGITKITAEKFILGYDGQRLMIPIFNEFNWCVNIRRYDLFKTGGPKMISYADGYGKAKLFPLQALQERSIYIVEGELDAILGIQEGINCITPSGGATVWDSNWNTLFKEKQVFIVPDNDAPGLRGAEKRLQEISKYAKTCKIIRLPVKRDGEDLTDWLLHYSGTKQKLLKLTEEAVQDLEQPDQDISPALSMVPDILDNVEGIRKSPSEDAVVRRAEAVWRDLTTGGAFFRNQDGLLFYVREGMEAMTVTNLSGHFASFLASRSPLINHATSTGRFIFNHIVNKARTQSELSKTSVWTMYDNGYLYVHAGGDKIFRLNEHGCTLMKNAINKERVLLELPVNTMAIKEAPSKDTRTGLTALRELFMDNLAMREEDRYLIVCWLASIFFRDRVKSKPLIRLLAKTASGKSTSSRLVSTLIYGEELLSHSASTVAATYEMSSTYPLLILDNLETRNMTPPLEDFLLVAATGGMKAKRLMASDTGLVMQHTNSLVLTNGIEPFNRHELIDRTMEIDLNILEHGRRGFQEGKVIPKLRANRNKIMSTLLYLSYKYVIPRIKKGEMSRIVREFGQHGKTRFNEYIALMSIVLDSFWGYMPLKTYSRPHDLVNYWLDSQTRAEHRQDEGTNDVLYFFNTFTDKHDQLVGSTIIVSKTDKTVSFKAATRHILSDFRLLAKQLGIRCPWQNERQLGTRIVDSEDILRRGGWIRKRVISNGRAISEYINNLNGRR